PALMIVDNVTNVSFEGQGELNEAFGLEGLMDWLNDLGRKKDSCVVGLHHVKEEYNNGDKPIPLKGVKNQIHRVPAAVLTIHKPDGDELRRGVSPVKNRDGEADPSGYRFAELSFNGARMQRDDYEKGFVDERYRLRVYRLRSDLLGSRRVPQPQLLKEYQRWTLKSGLAIGSS